MARALAPRKKRKVSSSHSAVERGDQETFAPEGQENIPHLMRELIPQSAFFTQVVDREICYPRPALVTEVEAFNSFAEFRRNIQRCLNIFRKDLETSEFGCVGRGSQQRFNWIGGATILLHGDKSGYRS